jgi:chromosome segregation ATPase
MKEDSNKNDIIKAIKEIEALVNEHTDTDKPYSDKEINKILDGLYEVRKNLMELENRYLLLAEAKESLDYRLKSVEDKLNDINKKEELKRDREWKYLDYAICSVIGGLIGLYISKLTGGK